MRIPATPPAAPVGVADLLVEYDGQRVLSRVYYPAAPLRSAWFAPSWLPHSRSLGGFLTFLESELDSGKPRRRRGALGRVLHAFLLCCGGHLGRLALRIPAFWLAPAASGERLPAVLLSHGLGGNRCAYAAHACALAASGRVVVALEHRDGTASLTRRDGAWLPYAGCGPPGERHSRVALRLEELRAVADVLVALAEGRASPHSARLLGGPQLLVGLAARLDSHLIALGHSFGGATALAFARLDSRCVACVAHDPWLGPALAGAPAQLWAAQQPWPRPCAVLVTLCEPWLREGTHGVAALAATCQAVRAGGGLVTCAGLALPTSHKSVSDVVLLAPATAAAVAAQTHSRVFALIDDWLACSVALLRDCASSRSLQAHEAALAMAARCLGSGLFMEVSRLHGDGGCAQT